MADFGIASSLQPVALRSERKTVQDIYIFLSSWASQNIHFPTHEVLYIIMKRPSVVTVNFVKQQQLSKHTWITMIK